MTTQPVVPNSLPISPTAVTYSPLTVTTGPDDGDTLATAAIQRLADIIGNGWRPYLSNPEVAAVQVAAYMAADLRTLVRDVGAAMYAAWGQQILGIPQRYDSPSQITTTWTAADTLGHTVPAGTQVSYPGSGTAPLTFTTRGDLLIPAGQSAVTGIIMMADQTGAYTNAVPVGPLQVQGSLVWLTSVVVTTAAWGGADAEADADYLVRLVSAIRLSGMTLVLPMDYAMAAVQADPAVYRAYAVPNYNALVPGTTSVERTVSVFMLDAKGLPVGPPVAASVDAVLQANRELNFAVVTTDATGNAITASYVAVNLAVTVAALPGYSTVDVQAAALSALTTYMDPGTWDGGDAIPPYWSGNVTIRPHDLSQVLLATPGVAHVDKITIGGGAVAISGSDNFLLSPPSFTKAVLPAGVYTSGYWTAPSVITVTVNPPPVS